MKKYFTFLSFFFLIFCLAQNTIDIAAKWNKGEVYNVKFTSEITDVKNKQKILTTSIFDSKFSVNEIADSKIKITWIYNSAKLDIKENNIENIILSKILNQPLKIRLSEFGKFEALENTSEIRSLVSEILDNELSKTAVDSKKALLNVAKSMISTDYGLEVLVTKNIKVYLFSFGYQFVENKTDTHNLEIPNLFGGESFPATETVKMTNVDETLKTCVIKTSKIADGDRVKSEVMNVLIKASKKNKNEIESQLKDYNLEFSESTEHEINYNKGIVNKEFFKRVMNFEIQDRIQLLKFSTQY